MTVSEICEYTGLTFSRQQKALSELENVGQFITKRESDGTFIVEKFAEKAGDESAVSANAERQRRFRLRHRNGEGNALRNGVTVTPLPVTDIEKEEDKEKNIDRPVTDGATADWIKSFTQTVDAVRPDVLRTLNLGARLALGRYLAYHLAGCQVDEMNNNRLARTFAAQIEEIAAKARFKGKTAGEFIDAALRLQRETKQPMRSLWAVQAALEAPAL